MSSSFSRSVAAVAAAGIGLLFLGPPASAQVCYPPRPDCVTTTSTPAVSGLSISLSDTTVTRGQTITATVAGFKPGSAGIITITTASGEQQIGSFTMPASGAATVSITIPATTSLGAHTVFARGTAPSGAAGAASQGILVGAAGTGTGTGGGGGSTLARTGVYVVPAAVIGLGLVGAGVALKRSGKRSKGSTAA